MLRSIMITAAFVVATPAVADSFSIVESRERFVSLVDGRDLTRFGIRLNVGPGGEITGRAFGTRVTGQWDWESGYFCRDLFFGDEDLGPNCQLVQVAGDTLRFTSDRGAGIYADLRLR
ncbi:dihydrodipicolinate reductase [Fontisubflavum oceani]|uniref:dihydrodipicolinate reductase n=1 Tax=Fontisubflavum oceani TaxID=2978973 RepID=UPI0025B34D27|nr:dihydrodipicolinate reductase [Fontisubflavum oceani]WJY22323.1 dihydrodipicolinate reductase [Fontisubflavum oceani]